MGKLQVEAEGSTNADLEVVWALVADANSYPKWGPWNDGGYDPPGIGPSAVGAVQWFRYGRRRKTIEKVLEVDAPRRIVYTVMHGLPVKNYRAEITLTPRAPCGASVRWAATWDKTFLGRMVQRKLQQVYRQVVDALVATADRQDAPD